MMLGLLRTALAASRLAVPRLPVRVTKAKKNSLPFIPTDWTFRFLPWFTRDKVRFMYRFNQISFAMGFGLFYFYFHTPFEASSYDHFYESPLYRWTKSGLERTGQLEENQRIKVRHFYPQTTEDDH
mmetsp:Transcript_41908/g.110989  ORF Transcript_41908/g.110989 Transcript_41908/m.110989 type:complete len:126 (-) Transcript_41908:85-462(-)